MQHETSAKRNVKLEANKMETWFCRVLSDTGKCVMLPAVLETWSAQEGQYRGTADPGVTLSTWKPNTHTFVAIFLYKGS